MIALALLLWAPRFSGPIDLRWDAGVYYLLGTSLAKGEGYRIASEPGSPEALQYPPLLPALVALHQWALAQRTLRSWRRGCGVPTRPFVVYSLVVLALAKRHLSPGFALAATALCMLHMMTIFLSDLLFAELPFAVVSVVFALVAASRLADVAAVGTRDGVVCACRAQGFFLRTIGVALLAAWVMEALIRRRWRFGSRTCGARVGAHHAMAGARRASARE